MATILILDDDKHIREMFRLALKKQGYIVHCAETADDAYKILEKTDVALLITDIVMPNVHGLEVISKMQEKYFGMPIIVCSGMPKLRNSFEIWDNEQIVAFFDKPLSMEDLIEKVKEAVPV